MGRGAEAIELARLFCRKADGLSEVSVQVSGVRGRPSAV
jgi:hypothetical protein